MHDEETKKKQYYEFNVKMLFEVKALFCMHLQLHTYFVHLHLHIPNDLSTLLEIAAEIYILYEYLCYT